MKNIAVIGAGISGLTCAYELQKAGHKVTVFEKNNYVGGRMSSRTSGDYYFDIGADHLGGTSYREMQLYCDELGIRFLPMEGPKFGIYRNRKIHAAYKAVGLISQLKFALFAKSIGNDLDFFDASTATDYDTETAYDYLSKQVSKEAADYMADAITGGYQFHNADEMSKGALIAYMQSVKNTDWTLHHLEGGMIALPNALAKTLEIHLNTKINTLSELQKDYDLIVLATTTGAAKQLLDKPTEAQKQLLDQTEFASTISLSYFIDAEKLPKETVVFTPYSASPRISSYASQKQKGPELIHDGKSMLSAWLHEVYAKTIFDKSKEEILEICRHEIAKVAPWLDSADSLIPNDIEKWQEAMPKFKHGHLSMVKNFLEKHQGENQIFFCGDYLNSPWTEGAIRCGQRVAKDILSRD